MGAVAAAAAAAVAAAIEFYRQSCYRHRLQHVHQHHLICENLFSEPFLYVYFFFVAVFYAGFWCVQRTETHQESGERCWCCFFFQLLLNVSIFVLCLFIWIRCRHRTKVNDRVRSHQNYNKVGKCEEFLAFWKWCRLIPMIRNCFVSLVLITNVFKYYVANV